MNSLTPLARRLESDKRAARCASGSLHKPPARRQSAAAFAHVHAHVPPASGLCGRPIAVGTIKTGASFRRAARLPMVPLDRSILIIMSHFRHVNT